jgi:hypothetical protein
MSYRNGSKGEWLRLPLTSAPPGQRVPEHLPATRPARPALRPSCIPVAPSNCRKQWGLAARPRCWGCRSAGPCASRPSSATMAPIIRSAIVGNQQTPNSWAMRQGVARHHRKLPREAEHHDREKKTPNWGGTFSTLDQVGFQLSALDQRRRQRGKKVRIRQPQRPRSLRRSIGGRAIFRMIVTATQCSATPTPNWGCQNVSRRPFPRRSQRRCEESFEGACDSVRRGADECLTARKSRMRTPLAPLH